MTALTRSRASAYAVEERRWKIAVAIARNGSTDRAIRARDPSVITRAAVMPTTVIRLITAVTRPVCRKVERASTSVVILVMMRPAISRS